MLILKDKSGNVMYFYYSPMKLSNTIRYLSSQPFLQLALPICRWLRSVRSPRAPLRWRWRTPWQCGQCRSQLKSRRSGSGTCTGCHFWCRSLSETWNAQMLVEKVVEIEIYFFCSIIWVMLSGRLWVLITQDSCSCLNLPIHEQARNQISQLTEYQSTFLITESFKSF